MAAAPEKPHYVGHRKRLRERFLKSGADSLADYELLELLLFMARPRADVKPLAKTLMTRFGSFAEVISADTERLAETAGAGESVIVVLKSVQAAALKLMREDVMDKPILAAPPASTVLHQINAGAPWRAFKAESLEFSVPEVHIPPARLYRVYSALRELSSGHL